MQTLPTTHTVEPVYPIPPHCPYFAIGSIVETGLEEVVLVSTVELEILLLVTRVVLLVVILVLVRVEEDDLIDEDDLLDVEVGLALDVTELLPPGLVREKQLLPVQVRSNQASTVGIST